MPEGNDTPSEVRRACIAFWKIKKIADKHNDERNDTDWDSMQEALMKIYKLVNKK